jgi:hypothetical protein
MWIYTQSNITSIIFTNLVPRASALIAESNKGRSPGYEVAYSPEYITPTQKIS